MRLAGKIALVTGAAEFNNDVVDPIGEVLGSNQRDGEVMHVLVAVCFAQCNQAVSVKGSEDGLHGVMRLWFIASCS